MERKRVGIYGVGNFGYALLKHLTNQKNYQNIFCFDRDETVRNYLNKKNKHPFLHKEVKLSKNYIVCSSPKELIENVEVLILAINSHAIESICSDIKNYAQKNIVIINTAKALISPSGITVSNLLNKKLSDKSYKYVMLAGGTIANDLFKHEPLGISIGSSCDDSLDLVYDIFNSKNLKVYKTNDVLGVEFASAFKNIVSILAGIINGFKYSFGSETHIISTTAGEIKNLCVKYLNAKIETFSIDSQCWGNDMWMSALGNSRNRKFGLLVAKNNSFKLALNQSKNQNITIEGLETIKCLEKIINSKSKEFPILNKIINLSKEKNTKKAVKELLELYSSQ